MPIPIVMPQLSDTMTEGTLLSWKVKPGDKIKIGQEIAEVQTDKATMVMEALDEGELFKILIPEGGIVPVLGTLAVLLEEGESPDSVDLSALEKKPPKAEPAAEKSARTSRRRFGSGSSRSDTSRLKASPLARKIAEDRGVNLNTITGTGPGGRIVAADVESAPVGGASAPSATPAIMPVVSEDDTVEPLSQMRKVIASRLLASKITIPHFYLRQEVTATALLALRKQINTAAEEQGQPKFTINDFILKAVALSCVKVPQVNSAWNGDSVVRFKSIGLAVAISVDDGLVTPVIRDAGSKTLLHISAAVRDMATRARNNQLKPSEFDGGTITVSNLGAWGTDMFDAIINPPQSLIVSVGSIKKRPHVNGKGELVVADRVWLGLSGDHRVIDGAAGASFLAQIASLIENPALMLL